MFDLIGVDNLHAAFIVKHLASLRREMEEAAPGGKLRMLPALVIFDVCNVLGLTAQERAGVLGPQNEARVDQLINSRVSLASQRNRKANAPKLKARAH